MRIIAFLVGNAFPTVKFSFSCDAVYQFIHFAAESLGNSKNVSIVLTQIALVLEKVHFALSFCCRGIPIYPSGCNQSSEVLIKSENPSKFRKSQNLRNLGGKFQSFENPKTFGTWKVQKPKRFGNSKIFPNLEKFRSFWEMQKLHKFRKSQHLFNLEKFQNVLNLKHPNFSN